MPLAYYDASNQLLKYALWNAHGVSRPWISQAPQYRNLHCVGDEWQPRIAYLARCPALSCASWDGSAWQIEIVDTGFVGLSPSLVIDRFDQPHIASFDAGNDVLKYSTRPGTDWTNQVVDSAGRVGDFHSITADSNGHPHIAYSGDNAFLLKYAAWDGAAWSMQTIEVGGSIEDCSIALDQNGLPRTWATLRNVIRYAAWNSALNVQNVDATNVPTTSPGGPFTP
jgi:hypothetical protein